LAHFNGTFRPRKLQEVISDVRPVGDGEEGSGGQSKSVSTLVDITFDATTSSLFITIAFSSSSDPSFHAASCGKLYSPKPSSVHAATVAVLTTTATAAFSANVSLKSSTSIHRWDKRWAISTGDGCSAAAEAKVSIVQFVRGFDADDQSIHRS
jgi:hypothetical protein